MLIEPIFAAVHVSDIYDPARIIDNCGRAATRRIVQVVDQSCGFRIVVREIDVRTRVHRGKLKLSENPLDFTRLVFIKTMSAR